MLPRQQHDDDFASCRVAFHRVRRRSPNSRSRGATMRRTRAHRGPPRNRPLVARATPAQHTPYNSPTYATLAPLPHTLSTPFSRPPNLPKTRVSIRPQPHGDFGQARSSKYARTPFFQTQDPALFLGCGRRTAARSNPTYSLRILMVRPTHSGRPRLCWASSSCSYLRATSSSKRQVRRAAVSKLIDKVSDDDTSSSPRYISW